MTSRFSNCITVLKILIRHLNMLSCKMEKSYQALNYINI